MKFLPNTGHQYANLDFDLIFYTLSSAVKPIAQKALYRHANKVVRICTPSPIENSLLFFYHRQVI